MTAYILLPTKVLRMIQGERARYLPKETGGFLIGIRRGPHIEVTSLTLQGPHDRATGTSFERRCSSHRERIHAAWRSSNSLETLVGDWHSHPHGSADASGIDRSAWRTLVQASKRVVIGLVDAGAPMPKLYVADESQQPFAIECPVAERDGDHLVFANPNSFS